LEILNFFKKIAINKTKIYFEKAAGFPAAFIEEN